MKGKKGNFEISVLIAVHKGEQPEQFKKAISSVIHQTYEPNEVVIVKDGPLNGALNEVIDWFKREFDGDKQIIRLESNQGAGRAYQIGVENCSNEFVAQIGADDIAVKDRFEKQILYFKEHPNVDVLGGYVSEITSNNSDSNLIRNVPTQPSKIEKWARFRSPVNSPSVMFRRGAVLEAGNYRDIRRGQDYELWARMLVEGYTIHNIPEVLTMMHAGDDFYARKGNLTAIKNEFEMHWAIYNTGMINIPLLIFNLLIKLPVKIAPLHLRKLFYKRFLRTESRN